MRMQMTWMARWVGALVLVLVLGKVPGFADIGTRRWIVDSVGRRINVPVEPKRIVALAPSVTEIVFALGQGSRLRGVSRFSDHPPQARHLPKVGSYIHLDTERIAALRPDLCIGIKDGNPLTVIEQLQMLNIPVYAVNPVDLETAMESIVSIGKLLQSAESAEAIVKDMRRRVDHVAQRVATAERRPLVFVQIGVSPIVSVGTNTFINELITLAGGTNATAGANPYPRFSKEQVITMAPDVMVISSMARATVFERVKAEWMQWPSIPAVRNGAVHIAPTNLFDRPTPRLVDGLEVMATYIHPQLFKDMP